VTTREDSRWPTGRDFANLMLGAASVGFGAMVRRHIHGPGFHSTLFSAFGAVGLVFCIILAFLMRKQ
jgi:hypothetical protein